MNTVKEFYYYPLAVKLDICVGRCCTLNDLSNKVCIPNKTEDLNLSVFYMITGINELKTITKHIACKCKYELYRTKCNSINCRITINIDVSVKNIIYVKKYV